MVVRTGLLLTYKHSEGSRRYWGWMLVKTKLFFIFLNFTILIPAGKTAILCKLKQNEFVPTIPTIGFNVETLEFKNVKVTLWDVGGQDKLRPLWKHYYLNTQAVIFVVDASRRERLGEAQAELVRLLGEKELKDDQDSERAPKSRLKVTGYEDTDYLAKKDLKKTGRLHEFTKRAYGLKDSAQTWLSKLTERLKALKGNT